MVTDSDFAKLQEQYRNLATRVDAMHKSQKGLMKDFTAHDKFCAERWGRLDTTMGGIVWGIRIIASGVIMLILETLWRVIGVG